MLVETENKDIDKIPITPGTLADRYSEYPMYKDFLAFFVSGVSDWNPTV